MTYFEFDRSRLLFAALIASPFTPACVSLAAAQQNAQVELDQHKPEVKCEKRPSTTPPPFPGGPRRQRKAEYGEGREGGELTRSRGKAGSPVCREGEIPLFLARQGSAKPRQGKSFVAAEERPAPDRAGN